MRAKSTYDYHTRCFRLSSRLQKPRRRWPSLGVLGYDNQPAGRASGIFGVPVITGLYKIPIAGIFGILEYRYTYRESVIPVVTSELSSYWVASQFVPIDIH